MSYLQFPHFEDAYIHYLHQLVVSPQFKSAPRGQKIHEIMPATFQVNHPSSDPLVTGLESRDKELAAYLAKESELFNSMTDSASDFAEASKFWLKIANPDGTVNSNYGKLIWKDRSCYNHKFSSAEWTPWDWATATLIRDKDTRQAVLPFLRGDHMWAGNKDVTCTVYGHFFIRGDLLYFHTHMRSQDIWLGMPYDCPWFMSLMEKMVNQLKPVFYPELKVGPYHHTADSLHLYDKHFDKAREILEHNSPAFPELFPT